MRLFVAVEIPRALREALSDVAKRVGSDGWRLSPPEQFHLTLRFLGPIDADAAIDAALARAASTCAPFSIELAGVGTFSKGDLPYVLWAGVRESASLRALARAVDAALDPLVGPRDQPFRAHITLARARQGARVDDDAGRGVGVIGHVPVDELVLFDSVHSNTKWSAAVHTPVARCPLRVG